MKKIIKIAVVLLLFAAVSCKSSFCGCANLVNSMKVELQAIKN